MRTFRRMAANCGMSSATSSSWTRNCRMCEHSRNFINFTQGEREGELAEAVPASECRRPFKRLVSPVPLRPCMAESESPLPSLVDGTEPTLSTRSTRSWRPPGAAEEEKEFRGMSPWPKHASVAACISASLSPTEITLSMRLAEAEEHQERFDANTSWSEASVGDSRPLSRYKSSTSSKAFRMAACFHHMCSPSSSTKGKLRCAKLWGRSCCP
mmetsp:Transcript_48232/g.138518  ORF Transcript_48232/g.138518 Transcript_48232/m.138518 type:complete len:213 (-) Transcript_48232:892-1530(-)